MQKDVVCDKNIGSTDECSHESWIFISIWNNGKNGKKDSDTFNFHVIWNMVRLSLITTV